MSGCLSNADIEAMLQDTCTAAQVADYKDHLSRCPNCSSKYKRLMHDVLGSDIPTIEGYEITEPYAKGGQGFVYLATRVHRGQDVRQVALKVLKRESGSDPRLVERFLHEANILAALDHPNIIKLWDKGLSNGWHYYAMEYVEGCSLDEYIRESKLTIHQKLAIFREICEAVSYFHQQAVIHRDLKSANIRVNREGRPYVIDFGLAKQVGVLLDPYGWPIGTLFHMAPEQTSGDPHLVDVRTDIYALGVILFRMLTDTYPYPLEDLNFFEDQDQVFRRIRETPPDRAALSRAGVDRDAQAIVLQCLSKRKEDRYQSVADLLADLRRYATMEPIGPDGRRLGWRARLAAARNRWPALVSATLLIAVAGWGLVRAEMRPDAWFPLAFTDGAFASAAKSVGSWLSPHYWFDDVMVVALDDDSHSKIRALAAAHDCPDVSVDSVKSWRQLHGAMMKRLARAAPRAVVWDFYFPDDQELYDSGFVSGVRILHDAGARVVVAAATLRDDYLPQMSGSIREAVDGWGLISARTRYRAAPEIALVYKIASRRPIPFVSLAAFGLIQHPDCELEIGWEGENEVVLRYTRVPAAANGRSDWLPVEDRIHLTDTDTHKVITGTAELPYRVAYFRLELPPQSALDDHTVSYADVFGADDETLRRRFGGRIVVIGDARKNTADRAYAGPGYRAERVSGVYFVAETIGALLEAHYIRRPTAGGQFGWCLAFALGGLVIGNRFAGREKRVRRYAANMLITVGCLALTLVVYVSSRYLCTPTALIMALWLGAGAGSWIMAAWQELNRRQVVLGGAPRPAFSPE
jgi:predicted Ser/Thr protein kinase